MKKIRVATRKSPLAMAQTHMVTRQWQEAHPDLEVEIIPVHSLGDIDLSRSLTQFSEVGIFVKILEDALLKGDADCALHCLKDLPMPLDHRFVIPCYLPREEVSDTLLYHPDTDLQEAITVATGSMRRQAFLHELYPHWKFRDLRGNINTRIAKVANRETEAIVLASVGLKRLYQVEEQKKFREHFDFLKKIELPPDKIIPAPGQGCLVLECLKEHQEVMAMLSPFNHLPTEQCVTLERQILENVEGGCRTPLGVWAYFADKTSMNLVAKIARNDQIAKTQIQGNVEESKFLEESGEKVTQYLLSHTQTTGPQN